MKGLIGGVLALSMLQAVLGTAGGAQHLGSTATTVSGWLKHLIDPSVPLIPDRRS